MIRLQLVFILLSAFVYLLTDVFGTFTRKERLVYAATTYAALAIAVAMLLVLVGHQPL